MKVDVGLSAGEVKRLLRATIDSVTEAPEQSYTLIFSITKAEPLQNASKAVALDYLGRIAGALNNFNDAENFRFNITMPVHNEAEELLANSVRSKFEAVQALAQPSALVGADGKEIK